MIVEKGWRSAVVANDGCDLLIDGAGGDTRAQFGCDQGKRMADQPGTDPHLIDLLLGLAVHHVRANIQKTNPAGAGFEKKV